MSTRRVLRFGLPFLLPLILASCIILPIPPHEDSNTRQNVGAQTRESIMAGKTTRTDVLLLLGEPDETSESHLRFTYTRTASEGGMLFAMVGNSGGIVLGGERVTYRYLVIRFDDAGVVSEARTESASCYLKSGVPRPCLARIDDDFLQTASLAAGDSGGKTDILFTGTAYWHRGTRGYDWFSQTSSKEPTPWGKLVLSRESLFFFASNADRNSKPLRKIAYEDIKDLYVDTFLTFKRVVIVQKNGTSDSFDITGKDSSFDAEATERAEKLMKSLWQSGRNK